MIHKTLIESVCVAGGSIVSPGLIRNVKILGFDSRNAGEEGRGRRYLPSAMVKGIHLYEGAESYVDHDQHTPIRPVMSKFGKFINVHFVEGKGLYGDYKYNTKHPFAHTFEGWVESAPEEIGFSHSARVAYEVRDGVEIITEILGVKSVDIVSSPATTKGIFESVNMEEQVMPDITTPPPIPAEAPGDAEAAKSHMDYLADLIAAIVRDPAMSGSEKMAKIKNCAKLLDGVSETPDEELPEEVAEEEEGEVEEEAEEMPDEKKAEEAFDAFAAKFTAHIEKIVQGVLTKTVSEAAPEKAKANAVKPVSTPPPAKKALTVDDFCESIGEIK